MKNSFCSQELSVYKNPWKRLADRIQGILFIFISAASDAPEEDTDTPEDLYPGLP